MLHTKTVISLQLKVHLGQQFNIRHFSDSFTRSGKIITWGVPIAEKITKNPENSYFRYMLTNMWYIIEYNKCFLLCPTKVLLLLYVTLLWQRPDNCFRLLHQKWVVRNLCFSMLRITKMYDIYEILSYISQKLVLEVKECSNHIFLKIDTKNILYINIYIYISNIFQLLPQL